MFLHSELNTVANPEQKNTPRGLTQATHGLRPLGSFRLSKFAPANLPDQRGSAEPLNAPNKIPSALAHRGFSIWRPQGD